LILDVYHQFHGSGKHLYGKTRQARRSDEKRTQRREASSMAKPNRDETLACCAPDPRADGGVRTVWLTPRDLRIERAVGGIKMRLSIPLGAYQGILLSWRGKIRRFCRITLIHSDPDLSVTLDQSPAGLFSKPALSGVFGNALAHPRRRNATLLKRRPRIFARRRPGCLRTPLKIFRAARVLFSREY
jgi:hypothetical protein